MMQKVLIIPYMYFPYVNANIICTKHVINKFLDKSCEVHVICMRQNKNDLLEENLNGVYIHRLESVEHVIGNRAVKGQLGMTGKIITKLYSQTSLFGGYGYTRALYSPKQINKVETIVRNCGITHILSISWPFASHVLASFIKNRLPSIKWYAYELDPFTYNFTLSNKKTSKREKLELKTLAKADGIISTYGISEYNIKKSFRIQLLDKTQSIPLPGLIELQSNEKSILRKKGKINLVYAGGFYGSLRSPKPLLDLMKCLPEDCITLHIIGGKIPETYDVSGLDIEQYGRIKSDVCNACISDADIAINFDNNIPNQAPSKIITYMSLEKPIVNFYFRDVMLGNDYLAEYKPHISICNDSVTNSEVITEFLQFIYSRSGPKTQDRIAIPNTFSNDYVCEKIVSTILGDKIQDAEYEKKL